MLMIELRAAANAATAAGFSPGDFRCSTGGMSSHSTVFFVRRNGYGRCGVRVRSQNGARAAARDQSVSDFGSAEQPAKPQRYHPSEEVEPDLLGTGGGSLTAAETSRTIIEVNSKATLMFSGLVNDEVHENIFWPDLPYVTDEHGNIYFQVKSDEDILQTLTTEEIVVQAIVGLDTTEILGEMEALGQSENGFSVSDLDEEDSDFDEEDEEDDGEDNGEDEDNYDKDWVAILGDENEEAEENDESLGDWAKSETMKSSHPMDFAKKIAEVALDEPLDFMDQPSTGLAIQGLLRPAFIEDSSIIQKNISGSEYIDVATAHSSEEDQRIPRINGYRIGEESDQDNTIWTDDLEKDEDLVSGFAFYKLEMIQIQLVSANGHQTYVAAEDFQRAQPDAIAHSAEKIISHLKAGGEKTVEALKSLCWRCKGIQVDECTLVGVDSMGFDVRVCSATQMQTLRFPFNKRAASEYSAERQLNDLLFPRAQKHQQKKEVHPTN